MSDVYRGRMGLTNFEIAHDEVPVMTRDEMLAMEGSGWTGDLEALRSDLVESV